MYIANPIYDTVFKYLLEDLDIARDLLALILDVEIKEISVRPQEIVREVNMRPTWSPSTAHVGAVNGQPVIDGTLNIYRLDFVALIKQKDGTIKKVLIELQKSKKGTNVLRFRRYLAENYDKTDKIIVKGKEKSEPLEIVTLYFLGFELEDVPTSIMKVKNCFVDITTGDTLKKEPKDKFVRLLNHESYMVQIPKLKPNIQSRVESVLNIFSQKNISEDERKINYNENPKDALEKRIVERLTRAIADENVRKQMDLEEELEQTFQVIEDELEKARKKERRTAARLEKKEAELERKDGELAQKEAEADKNKAEADKNKAEADKNKAEADKNKAEAEAANKRAAKIEAELAELKALIEAMKK